MLTKKQTELLEFIASFIDEHGYSPSYREIMTAMGIKSVSTVAQHVDNLIAKGVVKKTDGSQRSLEVVGAPAPTSLIDQKIKQFEEANEPEKADILRQAKELLK
ncbi:hypothetical protein FWF48_00660 [Candidatus Saccharibacteria bacterium]|nr:hypothetical protein [Candidatus Saccharibacteria bacterium]